MRANDTALPISTGVGQSGFASFVTLATRALKRLARAYRHRREVAALAGLEGHMLADIGITQSDLRDALSEPLWEDPTALLRERALERRWHRALMRAEVADQTEPGFHRPPTARPARQLL